MKDRIRTLTQNDRETLVVAAIVGDPELALEPERTGLSDEHDSLENARWARPVIRDAARKGAHD